MAFESVGTYGDGYPCPLCSGWRFPSTFHQCPSLTVGPPQITGQVQSSREQEIIDRLISISGKLDTNKWISVEDRLPPEDLKVIFWVIAKPDDECPKDSSGNIIRGNSKPHIDFCRYRCWSGLEKGTHWMLKPEPPE